MLLPPPLVHVFLSITTLSISGAPALTVARQIVGIGAGKTGVFAGGVMDPVAGEPSRPGKAEDVPRISFIGELVDTTVGSNTSFVVSLGNQRTQQLLARLIMHAIALH